MSILLDFGLPETASMTSDEWWSSANDLLTQNGFRAEMLEPILESAALHPRHDLEKLLQLCETQGIPMLVVSAGFSDLIERFLARFPVRAGTVRVSANRMVFENGLLRAWEPHAGPCHSQNKELTYVRERSFFEGAPRHALVLGDKPHDVHCLRGVPHGLVEHELRIGFFNPNDGRYCLEDYIKSFDLVLPGDHGLGAVVDILRR